MQAWSKHGAWRRKNNARAGEKEGNVWVMDRRIGVVKNIRVGEGKADYNKSFRKVVKAESSSQRIPGIQHRRGLEAMAERSRKVGENEEKEGR